jgi:diacylglycerol kinase (ATP)
MRGRRDGFALSDRWRPPLARTLNVLRLWNAGRYSIAGLREAIKHHAAVRQELLVGIVLVPAAILLGSTGLERAVLLASLLLVLIVELLNTAVETVVDRVGTESNELSGRAKDIGSAAVLVALINVPVVWGLVILG